MIRTPQALIPYLLALAAIAAGILWQAGDRLSGQQPQGGAAVGGQFLLTD